VSFTYHIDSDAGMLFVVGEGVITQTERLAALRAWLSDPAFRPGLHTLCDFSAATSTPALSELTEIVDLIKRNAASIGRTRLAVVTARPVTFGVVRQFEALLHSDPLQVEIFTDRETALAWLRGEG
jgi:hypothetical protein